MNLRTLLAGAAFALTAIPANAAVDMVDLNFTQSFLQTGPGTLSPAGAFFSARGYVSDPDEFDGGTLNWPSAFSPQPLQDLGAVLLFQSPAFPDLATLQSTFPTGLYRFDFESGGVVTQSVTVDHDGPLTFPDNAPVIADLAGLAAIDATGDFTLSLESGFTPNPQSDFNFTFLSIIDLSSSMVVYSVNFADPSTTDFLVGAGTLAAGRDYLIDISFSSRVLGLDPVSRVPNEVLSDLRTFATFSVAGGPAVPEPASWAMMICGLGAIGLRLRTRSAQLSAA